MKIKYKGYTIILVQSRYGILKCRPETFIKWAEHIM